MIHPLIEQSICANIKELMIEADNVANVISTHTLNNALLILTQVKYSWIPVLSPKSKLLGLINMSGIINGVTTLDSIEMERLDELKVADIELTEAPTVTEDTSLERILQLLTDYNFVCMVSAENIFMGIITRRTLLKKLVHLLHNLDELIQF
ncbi:MAG: cyclic-di-AMP-binding protein CbpB [Aerococcaceae bacterium]|nr:cyclic-di-AMP-binding protein CbpB [Aerococcaceae bacterium]